jgi:hypothetical protein
MIRYVPQAALDERREQQRAREAAALTFTPAITERARRLQRDVGLSEKDAESAQKLGRLQPFIAVFPQECAGQCNLTPPSL